MTKRYKLKRWFLFIIGLPIAYFFIALILTLFSVNNNKGNNRIHTIYLSTNGVHLDVVIPKSRMSQELFKDLEYNEATQYFSFGWGDENFYLNTPTWGDLTFKNAFSALFLNSSSLIHLTQYSDDKDDWVLIKVSEEELIKLNKYIYTAFKLDDDAHKVILANKGYGLHDDFYKANGSYSCFNTCNTWINDALKESGLKACVWTPFDFGLMNKHK